MSAIVRQLPQPAAQLCPTRQYRVEINGSIVQTAVHEYDDHVLIPMSVQLENGRYVRGMLEVDRQTFDDAKAWSAERGLNFVRLASIAERVMSVGNLISLDERRILPR